LPIHFRAAANNRIFLTTHPVAHSLIWRASTYTHQTSPFSFQSLRLQGSFHQTVKQSWICSNMADWALLKTAANPWNAQ